MHTSLFRVVWLSAIILGGVSGCHHFSEASGVPYTVCQKDTSQDDDCLATGTDTLSASVSMDSSSESSLG
ncbi:hypothetical protein [Vibrio diabolicus]|uniref:hypothetical protein n=1 Tax=Vibrio diabolicus TaxID=50719 RepID=UPI003750F88B